MKPVWLLFLIAILVIAVVVPIAYVGNQAGDDVSGDVFFFGVTYGAQTAGEAKLLIDKVRGYTNLFVVDSWDLSSNETALTEVCQYAVDANISVMVYFDYVFFDVEPWLWLEPWFATAKEVWGDQFLGIYLYDEPGGRQIDLGQWHNGTYAEQAMKNASDYHDAANRYVTSIHESLSSRNARSTGLPLFTSDYALYWFDYLAGYDTIFVELGWNNSRVQQIALCRGAANAQGKDWGAIITWTYHDPPYLANASEIYSDMVTAYQAGAKYVIVFNYATHPETNPYGSLTEEHFSAMQQFWDYAKSNPRNDSSADKGQVAFVLPKDYGWGTRRGHGRIEDNIWGFWPEDENIHLIGSNMRKLMDEYGLALDIIYDDPQFNYAEKYQQIFLWNSTIT